MYRLRFLFFLHFKLQHLNWTLARELFLLNFPNTSYTLKPTFLKPYFREINENEIIALRKCQGHFDCQQLRQTRRNTTPVESSFVENLAKNTLPKEISDLMNISISFLRTKYNIWFPVWNTCGTLFNGQYTKVN